MLQLASSEQLTGQCPNCGWCPPVQNAFRPNIMNEYVNAKGQTVILSETDDKIETANGVLLRKRDDGGIIIVRQKEGVAPQQQQQQQPGVGLGQNVVPGRDIPPGMRKTEAEVKATPKEQLIPSTPTLPTPAMSSPVAPPQNGPNMTDMASIPAATPKA